MIQKITARSDDEAGSQPGKAASNPESVASKLTVKEVGVLNDYVNMWTKSIE